LNNLRKFVAPQAGLLPEAALCIAEYFAEHAAYVTRIGEKPARLKQNIRWLPVLSLHDRD
jgi:hypothetical protein